MAAAFTIRKSTEADERQVQRLAALDDRPAPRGRVLLGYVDGVLVAARPLGRGQTVADPFRKTADVVALLDLRAGQERAA